MLSLQTFQSQLTSTDQVRLMQTWAKCNADGFRVELYSLKKTAEGRDKGKKEGTTDKVLYTTVCTTCAPNWTWKWNQKKKRCAARAQVLSRGVI